MDAQTFTVPLNKLKPSPANVRRTGRDQGISELAASIAAHGLINPLRVEPETDGDEQPTGFYLVHAGERRRRAMVQLAAEKKLRKAEPIPCLPRGTSPAEEESLAENVNTAPMHPADQYEAFARLNGAQGLTVEEIAARFGLGTATVRQRLRLGAASTVLMELYRAGKMNLDQLTAFCLTDDHAAQERVWGELSWNRSPEMIRRLLTRTQVPASDRRAVYVGADAYEAAGGVVLRDLFTEDGGGWFSDSTLLDRLVLDRLEQDAQPVRAEGWKWVEVETEFPYAQAGDMRRLWPDPVSPTEEEATRAEALRETYNTLEDQHAALPDLPDEVITRLQEIEAELDRLEGREAYAPDALGIAGAIVCLGYDGAVRIERGYIRREDDPDLHQAEEEETAPCKAALAHAAEGEAVCREEQDPPFDPDTGEVGPDPLPEQAPVADEPEEETVTLSDRLMEELTGHRTAALQLCLADRPDVALCAVTHALVLRAFYGASSQPPTCLRIEPAVASMSFLGDCRANREMAERHATWTRQFPRQAADLWGWIATRPQAEVMALLAFCAGRTLYAVHCAWTADPKRLAHADALATLVELDMTAWWQPTAERYFARVTKAAIRAAVREAKGDESADRISSLRKPEMAAEAERLVSGTGWLPTPLRTSHIADAASTAEMAQAAE